MIDYCVVMGFTSEAFMATDRKQLNVRMDDETRDLLPKLAAAIGEQLGLVVTNTDLFRMGMQELRKKYLTPAADPPEVKGKAKK